MTLYPPLHAPPPRHRRSRPRAIPPPYVSRDTDDVLDTNGVAQLLGVGRKTVLLMCRRGLPHQRVGRANRYSRAGVLAWLETRP